MAQESDTVLEAGHRRTDSCNSVGAEAFQAYSNAITAVATPSAVVSASATATANAFAIVAERRLTGHTATGRTSMAVVSSAQSGYY